MINKHIYQINMSCVKTSALVCVFKVMNEIILFLCIRIFTLIYMFDIIAKRCS